LDSSTFTFRYVSRALEGGEVRPTHRKPANPARWWRSRVDPFAHTWPVVEQWLETDPTETASTMLERLAVMAPDAYAGKAQLRTLQRRIKQWRLAKAKDLILGQLAKAADDREGPASAVPSMSIHEETTISPR
jgi:hypothetical protein